MTIYEHLAELAGKPVAEFDHESGGASVGAGDVAWRVETVFDGPEFGEVLREFVDQVDAAAVTHLVIGYWGASYDDHGNADPVDLLVGLAGRLPRLRALFLGDITPEEAEISWIENSDITRLFDAFPELEHLEVRGGKDLALRPVRSRVLRTLRFESGGLPAEVVRAVGASDLPALEHLDLWLGVELYGGDTTVDDLAGILGGERLPALRHLGLEDAEIADDLAGAVAGAGAPIVARLESLSLALGTLTDTGAELLLAGRPLTHLSHLDLHHHYLSDLMMDRVRAALPGVNLDQQETPDDDCFYVAVSE
ncbi:STM4015 family protein [Frankia sp. AgB32]|uniref:STM4015 family protein n=1 Tax=Frankia sp. AgB32 TaxID=631119 RepID=UPI0024B074C2|nr:STM4015 family protein [Frankia sp. AgB32]